LHNQGYAADVTNVVEDTSGQFFPRVKSFMRETGFYTNDINPPKQHFASRWLFTPFTTSDAKLFAKGTTAGQVQQQWMRESKDMNKTVTKLNPTTGHIFVKLFRRVLTKLVGFLLLSSTPFGKATGKLPNDNVKAAYTGTISTANDLDYEMRNANARTLSWLFVVWRRLSSMRLVKTLMRSVL
jgi:hypothetical protein